MNNNSHTMAKLGDTYDYIIDSDGNRVEFNDPRVIHCLNQFDHKYHIDLVEKVYLNKGWNIRTSRNVDREIINYARKILTGRECMTFHSEAGSIYYDIIERRKENEIIIYDYTNEGNRPCQAAGWPLILKTIANRLKLRNVVFTARANESNNFLGQGPEFGVSLFCAGIMSAILEEAETALNCLAKNKEEAHEIFKASIEKLIHCSGKGIMVMTKELKKWANEMKKIPLTKTLQEVPKIFFICSGGPCGYHPLLMYYRDKEIIPKYIEVTNYMNYLMSEQARRYGYIQGWNAEDSFKIENIAKAMEQTTDDVLKRKAAEARKSVIGLEGSIWLEEKFRTIAMESGLIYDMPGSYMKQLESGDKELPATVFHQATDSIGRLMQLIENDEVDAIVRVCFFGCQSSMASKALSRNLIKEFNIPYTDIQMEGPWLSVNQKRVLENIGIQAKLRKMKKMNSTQVSLRGI